jgi:HK97 family phage prohead protease
MKMEFVEPEPVTDEQPEPESAPDAVRKFYVGEMKTLKNGDIEAYVSTESIDRVGDIIKARGWMLDNYRKTGSPVLFSHDYSQPPIGNAIEMEAQRKGLWSVTRFHEKTQLSRDLAVLARGGFMKSWSVGFSPLEKPEIRKGEGGEFLGYIFNKQELLEYSLVPVPANAEAVSKAIYLAQHGKLSKQMAYIFAGPSPMAEEGSGSEVKPAPIIMPDHGGRDEHLAIMAGLHCLKRFTNVR